MVTTITTPIIFSPEPSFEILAQSNAYKYDRLNRLVDSKSFANLDYDNNLWMNSGNPYDSRYHNQFTYNANGGILTALAKNAMGETIDNQTYHRPTTTNGRYINNRTYAITDVATQTSGEDLLDQQVFDNTVLNNNNYDFTEIGERSKNLSAEIEQMTWTIYGKVKSIKRIAGSSKRNVTLDYDTQNKRIAKHVYTSDDIWINSEYYVRDAQGNLMATYRLEASSGSGLSYELTERHIYGSNSIGINTTPVEMIGVTPPTNTYTHLIGDKRFNGSNHLGNVLSVFTDKKLPLDIDNNLVIDGYLPDVIAANDYAPFGSRLSERTFNKELYPNSFNGKREDVELDGMQDYGGRPYIPMEREFPKRDQLSDLFPYWTPYQFAGNNPIASFDIDGNQSDKNFNALVEAEVTRRMALQSETNLSAEQLNIIAKEWTQTENTGNEMVGYSFYNCTNCSGTGGVASKDREDQYNAPETYRVKVKLKNADDIKNEVEVVMKESFQVKEVENPILESPVKFEDKPKPATGKPTNAPKKITFSAIPIYANGEIVTHPAVSQADLLKDKISILNKDPKVKSITINVTITGEGEGKPTAVMFSNKGFENIKNFLKENGLNKNIKINRGEVGSGNKSGVSFDVSKGE